MSRRGISTGRAPKKVKTEVRGDRGEGELRVLDEEPWDTALSKELCKQLPPPVQTLEPRSCARS